MDSFENKNYIRNYHDLIPVMLTNDSSKLPWILHAGESIKSINYNLLDGLLIGGKRLGHAVNLFKMGNLYKYIKNKGIVLEINPISNQTLKLVRLKIISLYWIS
jgi:adenosine deaminase